MKDGSVAEMGTHEELILKNGDYAELYNIQASAFLSDLGASSPKEKSEVDRLAVSKVSYSEKLRYQVAA
jgi:hypothetical protein